MSITDFVMPWLALRRERETVAELRRQEKISIGFFRGQIDALELAAAAERAEWQARLDTILAMLAMLEEPEPPAALEPYVDGPYCLACDERMFVGVCHYCEPAKGDDLDIELDESPKVARSEPRRAIAESPLLRPVTPADLLLITDAKERQ